MATISFICTSIDNINPVSLLPPHSPLRARALQIQNRRVTFDLKVAIELEVQVVLPSTVALPNLPVNVLHSCIQIVCGFGMDSTEESGVEIHESSPADRVEQLLRKYKVHVRQR